MGRHIARGQPEYYQYAKHMLGERREMRRERGVEQRHAEFILRQEQRALVDLKNIPAVDLCAA
ncbi:MAG TPA: hypothetical protein VH765_05140 [Xanthobacteraceae bacterium]|jgi:hypothetical protein